MAPVLVFSDLNSITGIEGFQSRIFQTNFAMTRVFAKIWLLAMIIVSVVLFSITAQTDDPWQTTVTVLAVVGAFVWVVWFIVVAAMPWIMK